MASPLTIIGIEVPRMARRVGSEILSGSEWEIAGHNIVERALKTALEFTEPANIRLLTGAPDQAVFDFVEKYGVVETELPAWIERVSDLARSANEGDVAVFMRAEWLLRDSTPLGKAIDAVRTLKDVERCEAAVKPERFNTRLASVHTLEHQSDRTHLEPFQRLLDVGLADCAILCPAFEVMKLRSFSVNRIGGVAQSGTAFVWIREDEQVCLQSPLDWLRAEVLLGKVETT